MSNKKQKRRNKKNKKNKTNEIEKKNRRWTKRGGTNLGGAGVGTGTAVRVRGVRNCFFTAAAAAADVALVD